MTEFDSNLNITFLVTRIENLNLSVIFIDLNRDAYQTKLIHLIPKS